MTSQSAGNTPDEAAAQTDESQDAEMSQKGHRTEIKLFPESCESFFQCFAS